MENIIIPIRVKNDFFVNYTYLIINEKKREAIVIDPAWEINTIMENLIKSGVTLKHILLTHSHFDHANLVEPLVDIFKCKVYMSYAEIEYYNFNCKNLQDIQNEFFLDLSTILVNIIRTPGHTKGSLCFFIDNNLFTGDTLFIEGCGVCSGKGGNPYQMYDSLNVISSEVNETTRIFPGHSYGRKVGSTFKDTLHSNIYLQFDDVEYFVKFRMRNNQSNLFNFK